MRSPPTTSITSNPSIRLSLGLIAVALLCLLWADIEIITLQPWQELSKMALGFAKPSLNGIDNLVYTALQTVAFAVLGVGVSCLTGFGLALIIHNRLIRALCAVVRSIHELFWALILLQIFGFHPLTGILAIAIPFSGIFAKVYGEILEENQSKSTRSIPNGSSTLSRFFYTHFPNALPQLKTYTYYRFECGLRSSTVLGFVGLPTLGFYLESSFLQGQYSQVATLLLVFYFLISTLKIWFRPALIPFYFLLAPFFVGDWNSNSGNYLVRFITSDIIPAPIRNHSSWSELLAWISDLLSSQALPGIVNTLVLTQIVLVTTAILTLVFFPLVSKKFVNKPGLVLGNFFLVVVRSTPEYILVFIFLLLWGPSLLPAIVALSLHNAAIVAHLIGNSSNQLQLRADHSSGINLYFYEVLPRVFKQFLALLFYRWEIIFRESAIIGILGIHTLGFFVHSAMEDIRFDRALFLIAITAGINILLDIGSRRLRKNLDSAHDAEVASPKPG